MPPPPTEADQQPRILHLINGESYAGIERAVSLLAQHHRNVRPSIMCLLDGEIAKLGVSAICCKPELVRMRSRFDLAVALRLARHIRQRSIRLLHAHTLRANLVAAIAGFIARIPVIATIHSPMVRDTENSARNRRNAWLQRMLIPWTTEYIAVSDKLKLEAINAGVPPLHIRVVRNGVETDAYCHGDAKALLRSIPEVGTDDPLIGTLSWLRPRKGIEVFLQSIPLIAKSVPQAQFLIAGKAEKPVYAEQLQNLAHRLGIADRVHFLGFRSDIPDLLASLSAFVMPSLFGEGAPFAVLEAMAASRAVIATRTEGNDEVIQSSVTGILVAPQDPAALAKAVIEVLSSVSLQQKLGDAARKEVIEKYDAKRMAAETEAVYMEALAARMSP